MSEKKIYTVRVEQRSVERFTVRASNREEAKDEADALANGGNIHSYDAAVELEEDDDGREVDNE